MEKTRVHAVYSDEEQPFFDPPPHNGRDVRDVQVNRVSNGKYFAGNRHKAETTQTKTAKKRR